VRHHLAVGECAGRRQPGHHAAQRVIRNGEQQKILGRPRDLVGRENLRLRQQPGGPLAGGRRHRRRGHHPMPRRGQRSTQDSTDAPGADNTNHQRVRGPAGAQHCAHFA
jgi:hypothetical protein